MNSYHVAQRGKIEDVSKPEYKTGKLQALINFMTAQAPTTSLEHTNSKNMQSR
jgi:hypothetical protein